MNQRDIHQKLANVIAKLLERTDLVTGDMEKVKETFMDTLYKILRNALDISITRESIEAYLAKGASLQDPLEEAKFLSLMLENDKTYILLNYYFAKFIQHYLEAVNKSKRNDIWKLVQEEGVDLPLLEKIENAYISLLPQPQPTTTQATPVQHVADDLPKDEIGKKIALAIAKALEEDKLSTEDYGELREALLATFPSLKTKGEIADYLQELAIDYPFFIPLLQEFHITQREERQSANILKAESLIKENKPDEALTLMK